MTYLANQTVCRNVRTRPGVAGLCFHHIFLFCCMSMQPCALTGRAQLPTTVASDCRVCLCPALAQCAVPCELSLETVVGLQISGWLTCASLSPGVVAQALIYYGSCQPLMIKETHMQSCVSSLIPGPCLAKTPVGLGSGVRFSINRVSPLPSGVHDRCNLPLPWV